MLTRALLFLALTSATRGEEAGKDKDPFEVLDQHLSQPVASEHQWVQILKAAAALDSLENAKITSDSHKLQITMTVRRFEPDELNIKVEDGYIVVEGDHKETNADKNVFTNRFVQRFAMPAGSRPGEVAAVLEDGVLYITVPKHVPPPPEKDVPIEARLPATAAPESTTAAPETPRKTSKPPLKPTMTTK